MALSLVAVLVLGLKQGIDMKGGSEWRVVLGETVSTVSISETTLKDFLKEKAGLDASIKKTGDGIFVMRFRDITEEEHQNYLNLLKDNFGARERSFSSIGPTIGYELRKQAIWGIILVLLGISLYVAYAFRKVSEPIKSWKYGIVTLITLLHDVAIPTGMIALLGYFKGVEIDTNFIVALLVVMGFSVHDTIVVFDRIRENLLHTKNYNLGEIINKSVNETFARSINTSLTLILVLVALLIFSPTHLFYFILTILVGTVFGTYSSIFVASPLLYLWGRNNEK